MNSRWIKSPSWLYLVALMAALAVIGVACGGEDTAVPEPTEAMMAPTQAMVAPTPQPTPTPVDLSSITSEMQKSISDAISGMEAPEAMSEGDVQQLVQEAVMQAATAAPAPLSEAEISQLVESAVAQAAASAPEAPEPLSGEQIASIVMAAIPTPVPTPTAMAPIAMAAEPVSNRVIFVAFAERESNDATAVAADAFWGQLTPMYEGLIEYDQWGQWTPMLAESWEVNSDFTAWSFKLQEGVQFHFGQGEFTAKDVAHTIEYVGREGSLAGDAAFYGEAEVEVVDDYNVTINLPTPRSNPRTFSNASPTFILSKDHFDATGQEGIELSPVATGPYQFSERKEGEYILWDRVPYEHYRNNPDFPELQLLNVKEPGTRLALLLTEAAHIGQVERRHHELAINRGLEVVRATVPSTPVYAMFGGNYLHDSPDYDPTIPWAAPGEVGLKVREAMNRAVNRDEIRETILGGRGEYMAVTFWHSSLPGWDQNWIDNYEENYGYDPERAKELLVEAGYPDGFTVPILMTPRAELAEALDVAEAIGNYWKAIGLDVEFNPQEIVYFVERFRAHDMDFIWTDATRRFLDPDLLRVIYTTGPPLHFYVTPELDAIYEELEGKPTTDRAERDALLKEAGQMIYDEYATVPLYWLRLEAVINPKIVAEWETSAYIFPRDLQYAKAVMK